MLLLDSFFSLDKITQNRIFKNHMHLVLCCGNFFIISEHALLLYRNTMKIYCILT
eukprot:c41691_g1_i1 orf=119-283(+)